ncbi:unnamed protein product [Pipistrellus nathusii]|uniref:Uncharacterized protein n=1 Tax=Pipistrellus nathusii TaxID=59473 RepID=A0ABN9ZRA4_PIPNA
MVHFQSLRRSGREDLGAARRGGSSREHGASGRSNGIVQSLRPSRHAPTQATSLSGQSGTGQPGSGPPSARPPGPRTRSRDQLRPPGPGAAAAAAVVWMFISADPVAPRKVQRPQRDPVDAQATQKLKQK